MPLVRLGEKQEAQKGRSSGQKLDPVLGYGSADRLWIPVPHRDDGTPIRQGVEQCVDAPDVVQEQEGESHHTVTPGLELLEERDQIM